MVEDNRLEQLYSDALEKINKNTNDEKVTIRNVEEIYSTVDAIFSILVVTNVKLKNEKFLKILMRIFHIKKLTG